MTERSSILQQLNKTKAAGSPNPFFQPKLTVNAPNDVYEQEADAVADRVMRMTDNDRVQTKFFKPVTVIQRKCAHCEEEEEQMQRKKINEDETAMSDDLEKYVDTLNNKGQSLPGQVRDFYEPRIGYDFSNVKVHTDSMAAKSAQSINALAFTSGNNIVFNQNQFQPESEPGKRLLAHELTHVVQQGTSVQTKKIQRATVQVNNQPVHIDYGNIIFQTNFLTGVQAQITTYTGAAPLPPVVARITALSSSQQRWLLFALDLLNDNTTAAFAALNRMTAVDNLITRAASATIQPLGNIANAQLFAREVLIFAGWTDIALTQGLTAPSAASQAIIDPIINPPATGGGAPGALNVPLLNSRLIPALTSLLNAIDPANRLVVSSQSISDIQAIGDIILGEARRFFRPFSDASGTSVFNLTPTWLASANISATTAQVPNTAQRINYLTNRANIVGRNTGHPLIPDTNIFADVNFDGSRPADRTELLNIVTTMEADPVIRPRVDRLIQHTGFQRGAGATTQIGIDPEFDLASSTPCQARWKTIGTLCHEVLHALAHPNFRASAATISFDQVVREGFTEVLGNQLFNLHVIPKAAADTIFKASLEVGLAVVPCPAPAAGTIGYGAAGSGAETIRNRVGNNNFRAAYFLGRHDLVGF